MPDPDTQEREAMSPRVISDEANLIIANKHWQGGSGLRLKLCHNARIINCEGSDSSFSGLWLEDCQNVRVELSDFHDNGSRNKYGNPVGHGIHLSGDTTVDIHNTICRDNVEDGIQNARSMGGLVRCFDVHCHGNKENAFDGKGGRAVFYGGILESSPPRTSADPTWWENPGEIVLLHRNFQHVELHDVRLVAHVNKALVSLNSGDGLVKDCKYVQGPLADARLFRIDGNYRGASLLPTFSYGDLTVINTLAA